VIFEHKQLTLDYDNLKTVNKFGKRHYLTPDGNAYPSITTCLSILTKKAIKEWRQRVGAEVANKISTQAARRGTKVHLMCEDYLNNELQIDNFLPNEKEMFSTIRPTMDEHINNIYAQEVALYSDYLGVAGRVDCIAEWDGKISVIDFKTSKRLKQKDKIQNYFQQASAYCVMFEERTEIPVNQIVILIAVDGEPTPQVFIEKRDNYIQDCIETISRYKEQTYVEDSNSNSD
jgi:genome maintenance exonuclease 1